jgi:3,4-dihydroxy 2-butanone 4-phosphate synthase/GTP cyclohydrolase II
MDQPAQGVDLALQLDPVEEAIQDIAAGKLVVVVDDADRENEGDLIMAASKATPEQVAFVIRHTSGILCTPVLATDARRLRLDPMVSHNDAPLGTAFTISIDYKAGLTTGISAEERTNTIRALTNGNVGADDFVRPGHIFPLISKDGGVMVRSGHTEAATDMAKLAGLPPVGLLAEIVNDDGSVKRLPQLIDFAREHKLKIISIADLIAYRQRSERLVERVGEFDLETEAGPARAIAFRTSFDRVEHLALVIGAINEGADLPVRIHRERIVNDVFEKHSEGDANLISRALRRFKAEGRGVLVYLRDGSSGVPITRMEGHGEIQTEATDADARQQHWKEVGVGAQILRDLGVQSIRILETRQRHYVGLSGFGIDVIATELIDKAP